MWNVQAGGAVGDGVERAQHQAQNEPDHETAVVLQCCAEEVDGAADACQNAEAQRTQPRENAKLELQQAADGLNRGQIHARNEQDGRAGDAGQHHGRDGHGTRGKEINVLQGREVGVVDAAEGPCLAAEKRQPHHEGNTQQQSPCVAKGLPEGLILCHRHEGDGAEGEPQKQRAHEINVLLKQVGEQNDTAAHADAPADAQLGKVAESRFARFARAPEQIVERIEKALVEAQNKRDGPARNAGDTVRQRHAEPVKCRQQHRNTPPNSSAWLPYQGSWTRQSAA